MTAMSSLPRHSSFLLVPLALLLCGCLGTRQASRPETQLRAETALARAIRAEQKKDSREAEQLLVQSLDLSSSIEDYPARATALINLARLSRQRHEQQKAESYISRALESAEKAPLLASELYYEKALVELSGNRADSSLEWAQKAIAAERGPELGSRLNLAARIQLARGRTEEAEALAGKGLGENRSAGLEEEEANSLRILGTAARERKDFIRGMQLLQEALKIDKWIGKSSKIAADLEELSGTAQSAGDLKESAEWLERAYEVHRAGGRPERARENLKALEAIYTSLGELSKAARAREKAGPDQPPAKSPETTSPSKRP